MKKVTSVFLVVLGLVAFVGGLAPVAAATEVVSVTGAAQGPFTEEAALGTVKLENLELGTGVLIDPGGSATGVFHATLLGHSLLGQAQQITIEGKVTGGALTAAGRADFNGTATLDLGDGTAPVTGIPFTVTVTTDSLVLTLDSLTLPAAGLATGAVVIQ